jgi:hypothetical protein
MTGSNLPDWAENISLLRVICNRSKCAGARTYYALSLALLVRLLKVVHVVFNHRMDAIEPVLDGI